MRVFILLIAFSAALTCKAQKVDSTQRKPDSVQIVMNEFLTFLQDKITVKEYLPVQQMVNAYLKSKEFVKPKRK